MKYPEVYKVIGAPGTGKTTRVVGNPELELNGLFIEEMENGYGLEDQMLVTYTNSGVDEAADRLDKMLNVPKSHIDSRVTTIHSQCFGTLGLSRDQVVGSWEKKQFCDKHNLDFGWNNDEDDIMAGSDDADEGNMLFQIYGWLQSNCKPLSEWEDCPAGWPGQDDPEFLMEEWESYKESEGLIGFGDMIVRVVENGLAQVKDNGWAEGDVNIYNATEKLNEAREYMFRSPKSIRGRGSFIDTKILYVDEVQDLTPLQWRWYLLQKLVCEKVYLGGDDDQSIYGWAGADPEFMLGEEGDFEVLDRTYRVPKQVWEASDKVIQQVENRQEKDVTPDGDNGVYKELRNPLMSTVKEEIMEAEDVFVLFRARYMIDEFRNKLHNLGIPYRNNSTFDTWSGDVVKIRDALAKIKNGEETITHEEFNALKDNVPSKVVVQNKLDSEGINAAYEKWNGVKVEKVKEAFDLTKSKKRVTPKFTWQNYLKVAVNDKYNKGGGELNYFEKEAIGGNLGSKRTDMSPEKVTLGTIHSSKGKERDTVILATDTTQTISDNMVQELRHQPNKHVTDAERRVYYVGMTRASRKLVMVEGLVNREHVIPIDTLVNEDSDEQVQTTLRR